MGTYILSYILITTHFSSIWTTYDVILVLSKTARKYDNSKDFPFTFSLRLRNDYSSTSGRNLLNPREFIGIFAVIYTTHV